MPVLKNLPILKKIINVISTIILIVVLSALIGLILAYPVMWLWNYVFGSLHKINVFQAWALNVLVGILFGQITRKNTHEYEY